MRERYAELGIPAELGTYFEDMPDKLADAHLFIGRAGASTIAELTAAGRPAILVPLPIATDDHQAANAREMVKAGGARIDPPARFHAERWPSRSRRWPQTRRRSPMPPARSLSVGRPNAARDLADLVERFGGGAGADPRSGRRRHAAQPRLRRRHGVPA